MTEPNESTIQPGESCFIAVQLTALEKGGCVVSRVTPDGKLIPYTTTADLHTLARDVTELVLSSILEYAFETGLDDLLEQAQDAATEGFIREGEAEQKKPISSNGQTKRQVQVQTQEQEQEQTQIQEQEPSRLTIKYPDGVEEVIQDV